MRGLKPSRTKTYAILPAVAVLRSGQSFYPRQSVRGWGLSSGNFLHQECFDAGNQRYSVGTETPRSLATSLGGIPLANNFLAD
jgi:hypothetical protein